MTTMLRLAVVVLLVVGCVVCKPAPKTAKKLHKAATELETTSQTADEQEALQKGLKTYRSARENKRALLSGAVGATLGAIVGATTQDAEAGSGDIRWKAGAGAVAGMAANEIYKYVEDYGNAGGHSMRKDDKSLGEDDLAEDGVSRAERDCDHGVIPWRSHGMRAEYITNIEGNWQAFLEYIERSPNLWMDDDQTILMDSNAVFIVGGDVCDGVGDIRIIKSLLDLKRRNPSRVFWVLGEREIEKLRLFSELDEDERGPPVDVYWKAEVSSLRKFCELPDDAIPDRMCRLEWILAETMNAPNAVSLRKEELMQLGGLNGQAIEAKHILGSFRDMVNPTYTAKDPFMLEYIRKGYLAVVLGDALFVHGGVRRPQIGFVPGRKRINRVIDWVKELNKWKDDMMSEYANQPTFVKDDNTEMHGSSRGGELLMNYGLPRGGAGKSIVTSDFLDAKGNRADIKDEVADWLYKDGIHRIFSGHTPMGLLPGVIRHKSGVTAVIGDISFARDRNQVPKWMVSRNMGRRRSDMVRVEKPLMRHLKTENGGTVLLYTLITLTREETTIEGIIPANVCGDVYENEKCVFKNPEDRVLLPDQQPYKIILNRWETEDHSLDLLVGRKLQIESETDKDHWWISAVLRIPRGGKDRRIDPMFLLSKLAVKEDASSPKDMYTQHYKLVDAKTQYSKIVASLDPHHSLDLPLS